MSGSRNLGPTGIYWGELACLTVGFSAVRTIGWEPSVVTVRCLTSQVVKWGVKHDPERFSQLLQARAPQVVAALTEAKPRAFVPIPSLPYRAHLLVRTLREGGPPLSLSVLDMYLVEARIVDTTEPQEIELVLADVRRFWGDYGVFGTPMNLQVGVDKAGKPIYHPGSVDPFTNEPRRTSTAVQMCLERLPGGPTLAYWPTTHDPIVRAMDLTGGGASPLEVAKQIVADARLTFALTLDGKAALWPPGAPLALGETPGGVGVFNSDTYDPARAEGVWKGEVAENLLGRRTVVDAPDEIVVCGPPPVQTIRVDYLEPVLPYDEPLPEGGTVRKLIPVGPDLLERLIGVFGGPQFQGSELAVQTSAADASVNLRTRPQGVAGAAAGQVQPPTTATGQQQRATLFRAPFLGDSWPGLDFLPRGLRDLLRSRLWRFWRVPERFWRFLPVLDRAERANGKRLAPMAEAYTWRQVEAVVRAGEDDGTEPDTRSIDEAELAKVVGELTMVRGQIDQQTLDLRDIQQAAEQVRKSLPNIAALSESLQRAGVPPWQAEAVAVSASAPKINEVVQVVAEKVPVILATLLGLRNPADFDPLGASTEELKRTEKRLVTERDELLKKTDPVKLAELRYAEAATARTAGINARGTISAGDEAVLNAAALALRSARVAKPPGSKRTKKVLRLIPAPRGPVEAASVSKEGLVEFPDAVGWPNDFGRADVRETYLMPLPVALTFGSWCLADTRPALPPIPAGRVTDNEIVAATLELLADQKLAAYAGDLGHFLPRVDGAPLALTFSRADTQSGKAVLGPWPFRVTAAADDERLQVLRTLKRSKPGGSPTTARELEIDTNLAEVLAEAQRRVAAIFAQPQVRDAGSISVHGPRPVNLDSKTTAVRWASDPDGHVITTVYVDPDHEPIPGFEADLPRADEGPKTFGIDLGDLPKLVPAGDDPQPEPSGLTITPIEKDGGASG